jgi:glucose 1-dehydrogenase
MPVDSAPLKLLGKAAFVTGAARGIGRGCALELARAGADVVVNDRERSADIEALETEIRALGRKTAVVPGDVFARPSCEQVASAAVKALGRIDIFVSNPAYGFRQPFLEYSPEKFDQVIQGSLTGGFHMSQLVARHMVARGGGGKIVFISSIQARMPFAGSVAYNAAKSGLIHMAHTIAHELLPHRINVNVILPGWIDTPGEHEAFGTARVKEDGPKMPWGRIGQPEDIGKAAVFLASDAADYITAATLQVDGGLWLNGVRK